MAELIREQVLDIFQNDWAMYVSRFQNLSLAAQIGILTRQGYISLTSLLAHVLA